MSVAIQRNHTGDRGSLCCDQHDRGAFTLVEVLCALAIVAILTAIALPTLRGARNRMARARTRSELAVLAQALEEFRRHYGDYPQTGDFAQASPETSQTLETAQAQAKFFNALTGVFGPRGFCRRATRQWAVFRRGCQILARMRAYPGISNSSRISAAEIGGENVFSRSVGPALRLLL